jgi:hypothetical protein
MSSRLSTTQLSSRRISMEIKWKHVFGLLLAFLLGVWFSNVSVIRMTPEAWAWWMVFAGFILVCATFTGGPEDGKFGAFFLSALFCVFSFLAIFTPTTPGIDFYQTAFFVISMDSLFITINLINKLAIWIKERRKFEQDKKRMELLTT